MEVAHTAIWVSDLEASVAFYEGVLGLEHVWDFTGDDGVVNYYVGRNGGARIQFKYDENREELVEPSGIDHVALVVDDTDAAFEHVIAESDAEVVTAPTIIERVGRRIAFVTDPDGYVVEFVEVVDDDAPGT